MPRLLTSLLVLLLSAWPPRLTLRSAGQRARGGRLRPSPLGVDDVQDAVQASARARARALHEHQWAGEARFSVGQEINVVRGRWRLTLSQAQRAHTASAPFALSLDPAIPEVWETELAALLTLQTPGARLAVARADAHGWRELELRAPTRPETVVQLDRAAVARVLDADADSVRVELRVHV